MNKIIKKEIGITLIALIITIIVLLILAGVTIAMVVGDNGIISKAKTSREQTMISQYKEKIELVRMEAKLKYGNEYTLEKLKDEFDNKKDWVNSTEIITENETNKIKLITKDGYIFYVTENTAEYKGSNGVIVAGDTTGPEITKFTGGQLNKITISATDSETRVTGYALMETAASPNESDYENWDGSETTIDVSHNNVDTYLWVKNSDNATTTQKFQIHQHSGDSSTNGGCYTKPVYHQHSGSETKYGSCYTTSYTTREITSMNLYEKRFGAWKVTDRCPSVFQCAFNNNGTRTSIYGIWFNLEIGNITDIYWAFYSTYQEAEDARNSLYVGRTGNPGNGWSKTSGSAGIYTYNGSAVYFYNIPWRQITLYNCTCGKTTDTIDGYGVNCGFEDGQLIKYEE